MSAATAKAATASTALTAMADGMTKAESLKRCETALTKMVTAVRSTFQSLDKMEPAIHAALLPALEHAQTYRDARPVDKIIRSLIEIGKATNRVNQARILVAETRAWVRTNSPIRWEGKDWTNAKVNVSGKNEFTPDAAAKTAFYETEAAKKQRALSAKGAEDALAPITPKVALARLQGLLTWLTKAKAEKNPDGTPRQIVKADKIEKAIKSAISAAEETFSAKDLAEPVNEAKVQSNIRVLKSGTKAHRKATARSRKSNGKATVHEATATSAAA